MSDLPEVLSDIAKEYFPLGAPTYNHLIRASIHIRSAEAHIKELETTRDLLLRQIDVLTRGPDVTASNYTLAKGVRDE